MCSETERVWFNTEILECFWSSISATWCFRGMLVGSMVIPKDSSKVLASNHVCMSCCGTDPRQSCSCSDVIPNQILKNLRKHKTDGTTSKRGGDAEDGFKAWKCCLVSRTNSSPAAHPDHMTHPGIFRIPTNFSTLGVPAGPQLIRAAFCNT